jgi:hypothetical protein
MLPYFQYFGWGANIEGINAHSLFPREDSTLCCTPQVCILSLLFLDFFLSFHRKRMKGRTSVLSKTGMAHTGREIAPN